MPSPALRHRPLLAEHRLDGLVLEVTLGVVFVGFAHLSVKIGIPPASSICINIDVPERGRPLTMKTSSPSGGSGPSSWLGIETTMACGRRALLRDRLRTPASHLAIPLEMLGCPLGIIEPKLEHPCKHQVRLREVRVLRKHRAERIGGASYLRRPTCTMPER